jgi:hypothetical protein
MYNEILKRHKPKGWRVYHSARRLENALACKAMDEKQKERPFGAGNLAVADPEQKTVRGPIVVCEYTLHIILHEFAHVALGHWGKGASFLHKEEFEADRLAMEWMRLDGIRVTPAIKYSSKRYVRDCIARDEASGVEIAAHIRRKVK